MKLGCMLYSLGRALADGSITVPDALALMKSCGAEGVDLGAFTEGYSNAEMKRLVEDAGLQVSSAIGGANLTTGNTALRVQSLEQLRRVIDAAVELGTRTVLITPGACAPGQDRSEARRNVASALAEVLPYAEAAQVTLTIEDYGSPNAAYQTSDECLECCELAGPGLMMTYDSGNMLMGDEDPVAFLHAIQSRIAHVHAKDWEPLPPDADYGLTARSGKKYVGTVVGQGVLDYPAIIHALKAIGYKGFVSLEYEGRGNPVAAVREGMAYLRELIGGI